MLPMKELRVSESDGMTMIEGHAAVFDSWSETLGGIFPFKEIVRKGSFAESIGKDDIRALFSSRETLTTQWPISLLRYFLLLSRRFVIIISSNSSLYTLSNIKTDL